MHLRANQAFTYTDTKKQNNVVVALSSKISTEIFCACVSVFARPWPRATELVRAMQNGKLTPGEAQEMIRAKREELAASRAAADAPADAVPDVAPAAAAAPSDEILGEPPAVNEL